MNKAVLMIVNGTLKEYRRESTWSYRRRMRSRMRYVWPVHETFFAVLEVLFWLLAGIAAAAAPVAFVMMFINWWLA